MKIAVLSGKGGTGKTFVSVNLACAAKNAAYFDCDVEEPNGNLFLKPEKLRRAPVSVRIPAVDPQRCTGCRLCVEFCRYHALALIKNRLMIFPEVCHSCGGCTLFCPQNALTEREREIGLVEEGISEETAVFSGCLNLGEASGVPVIKELMKKLPQDGTTVIDCPPGSGCMVMESIREADFCLFVAEPTLFGAHNLAMVYELAKRFQKPLGAVLNKVLPGENPAKRFCEENRLPVLAEIPYDGELGALISRGKIAVREKEACRTLFENLLLSIEKEGAR